MNEMVIASDFFGKAKRFIICFETTVLKEEFVIGVDTTNPNEISIFHKNISSYGVRYDCLNTFFYNVFEKYNYSYEGAFKKEIKKWFKKQLTNL